MGSYPSVYSVPSSAISKDIAHIAQLFPDKFKVETTPNSQTATLFANDGKVTLVLVDASSSASVTALVLDESDIKAAVKRQKKQGQTNANSLDGEYITAVVKLPGSSVLLLVSPATIGSKKGRQCLAQALTRHSTPSTNVNVESAFWTREAVEVTTTTADSTPSASNPQSMDAIDSTIQLPSFPTLDFRLLQKGGQLEPNFPLNTRTGVPFDTALFKGKVLFLLRPTNPAQEDPYWNDKIFAHKQRRVIVQVQGKFKTKPKGILYAGGEISEPMKMGLLAKG